jgi:hypothetical protein
MNNQRNTPHKQKPCCYKLERLTDYGGSDCAFVRDNTIIRCNWYDRAGYYKSPKFSCPFLKVMKQNQNKRAIDIHNWSKILN